MTMNKNRVFNVYTNTFDGCLSFSEFKFIAIFNSVVS